MSAPPTRAARAARAAGAARAPGRRAAVRLGTLALALAALLLSSPAPAAGAPGVPAADRAVGTPLPVAHRGASAYAPENTLAAVDRAGELGIRWVEVDVQRTRDEQLIVLHDTTLNRTTDAEEVFPGRSPWKVADFAAEEIARLDAGSWFGTGYAGEKVPTLGQLLVRMEQHGQNLLLEIKQPERYPGIERQILSELRTAGWLDAAHLADRLIVQSFNAEAVRTVHRLHPWVKTGYLGAPAVAELPGYARFTDQINPHHTALSPEYVAAVHALPGAHGRPLEVFTWTVNDAPTAAEVARIGVDGVISDAPDVVRNALDGRTDDGRRTTAPVYAGP